MTKLQRLIALLRWWWRMPVRTRYPMNQRSQQFHDDTRKWMDEKP